MASLVKKEKKNNDKLLMSLLAVFLGFLVACLLILVSGSNPIDLFVALFRSLSGVYLKATNSKSLFNLRYPLNWLLESLPLILAGLSVGFANKCGLFNIGGEGQYIIGSFAASYVALKLDLPPVIHPIVCLLAGGLAGALWGLLPGLLKSLKNINEVVICVMMNYAAFYLSQWATYEFLPINMDTLSYTISFPESANFHLLNFGTTSKFHFGFILVVIAAIGYHLVIHKTTFGYALRATGHNKEAARYAGMKVKAYGTISMMIAGALMGFAGAMVALGVYKYGQIFKSFSGYGFNGISVALVGGCGAGGIVLSGLLFGLLDSSSTSLQMLGVSKEIVQVIQASILVFIAIQLGLKKIIAFFKERKVNKNGRDAQANI